MTRTNALGGPTDRLQELLEQIGRKPSGLEAENLLDFEPLLKLACVQRKAGDESAHERAMAAERILREGIDSLPTQKERWVGEAALAAHPQYSGKSVEDRKATLAKEHGVSIDTYKDLRPKVYSRLAAWLYAREREASGGGVIIADDDIPCFRIVFRSSLRALLLITIMKAVLKRRDPINERLWSTTLPSSTTDDILQTILLDFLYCIGSLSEANEWIHRNDLGPVSTQRTQIFDLVSDLDRFDKMGQESLFNKLDMLRLRFAVRCSPEGGFAPSAISDSRFRQTHERCANRMKELFNEWSEVRAKERQSGAKENSWARIDFFQYFLFILAGELALCRSIASERQINNQVDEIADMIHCLVAQGDTEHPWINTGAAHAAMSKVVSVLRAALAQDDGLEYRDPVLTPADLG